MNQEIIIENKEVRKYGRYKERKLIHFGVDTLKAYIEFNYKPKIFKLGLSINSNLFYYDNETTIELGSSDLYSKFDRVFILKDIKTNIQLAFILIPKVGKVGAINYNNLFEVSGQGLILKSLKYYFNFLKWSGFTIEKFKRVDICFDMNINIQYIYDVIVKKFIEGKTIDPIIKKGVLETLYIGERNTKKNTYQLIRIYNKILDTKNKNKEFLYDFENVEYLTRFEVELRRDKAQFLTEKKLLDDNYIFSIIVNTFYKMNYQFFKFLHFEDFERVKHDEESVYELRKELIKNRFDDFIKYGKDFKNDGDKQRTLKLFITCAKRLYKNGYSRKKLLKILKLHGIIEKSEINKPII